MKELGDILQQGKQDVISGDEVLGTVLFLSYFAVSPSTSLLQSSGNERVLKNTGPDP